MSSSFVSYLQKRGKDRGFLASLRRGLSDPLASAELFPAVIPLLPKGLKAWEEEPYFFIAALYGHHPMNTDKGNFGSAYRRLRSSGGEDAAERRFVTLLGCDREDLYIHLRQAVGIMKSKDIPVNYDELFKAIRYWSHQDKFIQKSWAKDFWGSREKE